MHFFDSKKPTADYPPLKRFRKGSNNDDEIRESSEDILSELNIDTEEFFKDNAPTTSTKANVESAESCNNKSIKKVEAKIHDNDKSNVFNKEVFIKEKFLVEMPNDFYQFWELCKSIKPNSPSEAFKNVNLELVGPYDVLAEKFLTDAIIEEDRYLLHWRYYYDPPEFQTVIKGNDQIGFHIGYFRDTPEEMPAFLATNCSQQNGEFKISGDNVFAAV